MVSSLAKLVEFGLSYNFESLGSVFSEDKLLLQVIGLKGVMLLIFAPDIRVGRECLLNIYNYFNESFINHDNVLIPCTNNFDQTRSFYYYKCK